jgi:hypothetical protein
MSKNIALHALKIIVSDRSQAQKIVSDKTIKEHQKNNNLDSKVVSIAPFLRRNAGFNFGGFVA